MENVNAFVQQLIEFRSALREYSIGIVTEHKKEGSDIIRVTPMERVTMQTGLLNENKTKYDLSSKNAQGVGTSSSNEAESVIEATWYPMGDNHLLTSPDVRANETVMIYKYADEEKYFWNTIAREPGIRRLEDVVYAFGNLRDGLEPWDLESSYWMRWDTMNDKCITIRTTTSDGEQFAYTFKINPGESKVTIEDSLGNIIELDTPSNNISLTDISGGRFETRDGHPKITGPKGFLVDAPNSVFTGNMHVQGNVMIDQHLQAANAYFPGGHGPH